MRVVVAIATGVLAMANAADAAPTRPAMEHLGTATLNGQSLPFSNAVRVGDIVYLSGQIGVGPDGKVPDGIEAQTKLAMENVGAVLKRAGVGYDRIFHCTVFLADMKDWPAFNKVYVGYFTDGPLHARSAVDVDGLALGALVELECQAYAPRK